MKKTALIVHFCLIGGGIEAQEPEGRSETSRNCVYSVQAETIAVGKGIAGGVLPLEDGTIVLVDEGGTVHFINSEPKDGQIMKTIALDGAGYGTPALVTLKGEQMITVPTMDEVHFFNMDGGKRTLPMTLFFEGRVSNTVIATEGGTLLVGTNRGAFVFILYKKGVFYPEVKSFQGEEGVSTFGRKPLLVKNPQGREVIVTGSHDGGIYVFGEDGTLIRRIETHSPVGSPVVLTPQGHLVAGLYNGMVVTFSLDGEKVGEFRTEGAKQGVDEWVVTFEDGEKTTFKPGVSAAPVFLDDGTMVVASGDGRVSFVDPETGGEKASFQTRGIIFSTPVVMGDGTVAVASRDGKVYFLNPGGSLKAEFDAGSTIFSDLSVMTRNGKEIVLVGDLDGKFHKLQLSAEPTEMASTLVEVPCPEDPERADPGG